MEKFKCLLAPTDSPGNNPKFFELLRYPLLASPKIDGIRCITRNGVCMSRTDKVLPNKGLATLLEGVHDLDGELVVGSPMDPGVYGKTQSVIMSHEKDVADVTFYVFDIIGMDFTSFTGRLELAAALVRDQEIENVKIVNHRLIDTYEDLLEYEAQCLQEGYEGVMLRDPEGWYKHGRSTIRQGHLIKLKRFQDLEVRVVRFNERISLEHKAGMGTLGSITVIFDGEELDISCGVLTKPERQYIWDNKEEYVQQTCTMKYFAYGMKDKPRFPRFVGWRIIDED